MDLKPSHVLIKQKLQKTKLTSKITSWTPTKWSSEQYWFLAPFCQTGKNALRFLPRIFHIRLLNSCLFAFWCSTMTICTHWIPLQSAFKCFLWESCSQKYQRIEPIHVSFWCWIEPRSTYPKLPCCHLEVTLRCNPIVPLFLNNRRLAPWWMLEPDLEAPLSWLGMPHTGSEQ